MATASAPTVSAREQKERDEYRAKDDARALQEAEAIESDQKRMTAAVKHLKHAQKALHRTLRRSSGKRK